MRKLTTAAFAALAIGVFGLAGPALADDAGPYAGRGYSQSQPYSGDGYGRRDRDYDDRAFDERRYEGRSEQWERGWRRDHGDHRYGHHRGHVLPYWLLVRRIERQGYFGVRGLRPSRFGYGWRAFARYRIDGHGAMLRVDPYTGRVLASRHL